LSKERKGVEPEARDAVLHKLDEMRAQIGKSSDWSWRQKRRLLRFLEMQLNSWGLLEDPSSKVRKAKEAMFLSAWDEFTEDLKPEKDRKIGAKKNEKKKKKGEAGLEVGASTARTMVQGGGKGLEGVETAVGTEEPAVDQATSHPDSHTVLVPQVGEVELSQFAVWAQGVDKSGPVDESTSVDETVTEKTQKSQT
jgi:hypothetical protein